MTNCEWCYRLLSSRQKKACSIKCARQLRQTSIIYSMNCIVCDKIFFTDRNYRIFCSNMCKFEHFRENRIGAFHDPKIKKINTEKGHKTCKERKLGWWDSKVGRRGGKIGGHIGGQMSAEILRKNLGYLWKGVKFRSMGERECAKKLLTKPILGRNCNIKICTKTFDFKPIEGDKMFIGKFVEYHPNNQHLHPGETKVSYYKERRRILNNNGFKNKKLIIIQDLKELY